MTRYSPVTSWVRKLWAVLLSATAAGAAAAADGSDAVRSARSLLEASSVRGGIVVHLGSGDGRLTAALGGGESYTVHGLEADPAQVAAARRHIQSAGLYGRVSVEQYVAAVLPYRDNLINLVVVQDPGKVTMDEVMRVLVPRGVACIQRAGKWETLVKPRPGDIGQWSHFLHDASNNAVTHDTVVGPPRSLQWIAPPLWLRSHETPSGIQSPVSAGGRLFYFLDEGLIGITDERLDDRWSLVCRDAFNGRLLWKRALGAWGWRAWARARYEGKDWTKLRSARTVVPATNQRLIVAGDDRLYATLDYRGPMSILDAASGVEVTTIAETLGTQAILVSDGVAVAHTQQVPLEVARRRGRVESTGAALVAVSGRTGKMLWQKETGAIRPLSWAIDRGRIVYLAGKNLVALDLKTGDRLWRVKPTQTTPKAMLTVEDVIVMQGGKWVAAHDATDGKPLWHKTVGAIGGGEGEDLFVVDGLVWRGMASVDLPVA